MGKLAVLVAARCVAYEICSVFEVYSTMEDEQAGIRREKMGKRGARKNIHNSGHTVHRFIKHLLTYPAYSLSRHKHPLSLTPHGDATAPTTKHGIAHGSISLTYTVIFVCGPSSRQSGIRFVSFLGGPSASCIRTRCSSAGGSWLATALRFVPGGREASTRGWTMLGRWRLSRMEEMDPVGREREEEEEELVVMDAVLAIER